MTAISNIQDLMRKNPSPVGISAGNDFFSPLNKFGRTANADLNTDTDVWDGANSTDNVDEWIAPTEARTHAVVSTSTEDKATGTGAYQLVVYGLTAWDADETSETVTLNGTTAVNTANQYVIIHRMRAVASATTTNKGVNVGVISATAATDSTLTAQLNAGEGQTQMAIYGVPSTKSLIINDYYCSAIKRAASLAVEMTLLVNTNPDVQLAGFTTKHTIGLATEGSNYMRHEFNPPFKVSGPAIVKIRANSSADNTDVSAGFDGVLVDA